MNPTPAYNAWRLTCLTQLPLWALGLVAAALVLGLWFSTRGVAGDPSRLRRATLGFLRVLACLLLFALVLEPGLELRAETRVRARIALLLDTSKSMRFSASVASSLNGSSGKRPSQKARIDELLDWLSAREPELRALASRFQIDVYGFDKELQPHELPKLISLARNRGDGTGESDDGRSSSKQSASKERGGSRDERASKEGAANREDGANGEAAITQLASGSSTDILGALDAAAKAGSGGRPLAGIILASDGADNASLSDESSASASSGSSSASGNSSNSSSSGSNISGSTGAWLNGGALDQLQRLEAPVFALPIGGAAQKDLAIERVRVDDFAFVRSAVNVNVRVSLRGFGPTVVPLTLRREGQVIAEQELSFDGKKPFVDAEITFVPDRTGKFAFTISAPVYPGEAVAENNSRSFVLNVIRDRVRVLQVVGRPSWDERFLRQLLKKDPNVDLISFFILRTPGDDSHSSPDELSLIPFPTTEIFQEQLRTFDLVIFQNFDHRPYRMSQYLDGIASYIREGGAFAMIGGEQSFGAGDYANGSIEEILPISLPSGSDPRIDEAPAQLQLTDAGKRHPVTQLLAGAQQNAALWASLPRLPGLNTVGSVRPGSQVLLRATDGRPVLVVGEAGQGRSVALLTDSSWMWSFVAAGEELGPRAYETFWHAAIRWLVRDPALTPMRLQAERPGYEPGEPVQLDAEVRGADYEASAGAAISVQLFSGAHGASPAFAGPIAGADGSAVVQLPGLPPGAYRAQVTARRPDGTAAGEAEEAFVVAPSGAELQQPAPRPEVLTAIAQATHGRVISASDSLRDLPFTDPERTEVGQRTTRPLWDTWMVLAALCLVVGSEWLLRRRWGYA